jgi:hypothetical protein
MVLDKTPFMGGVLDMRRTVWQKRDAVDRDYPYELNRFISAQKEIYDRVLAELRDGLKRTHWMWFIFPQIDGLGHSTTTRLYPLRAWTRRGNASAIPFWEQGSWRARKRSLLFRETV